MLGVPADVIARILLAVGESASRRERPMQDFPGFEDTAALAGWAAAMVATYAGAAGQKVLAELGDRAAGRPGRGEKLQKNLII